MKNDTQNLIACVVKYIAPNNYRGSQIKISLPRFEETLIISYKHEARDVEDGAVKFFSEKNLFPTARACGPDHSTILLFSFDSTNALLDLFRK